MPRFLETTRKTFHWDMESNGSKEKGLSQGRVTPDYIAFDKELDDAVARLTIDQWEIKSVTPIIESYYYDSMNTAGSLTRGVTSMASSTFAAPVTVGVIIFAQRWVEISDEEYANRRRVITAQKESLDAVDSEGDRARRYNAVLAMPIERVRGLMSEMWMFNGEKYHTEGVAKRVREEMAQRARDRATDHS